MVSNRPERDVPSTPANHSAQGGLGKKLKNTTYNSGSIGTTGLEHVNPNLGDCRADDNPANTL